MWMVLGGLHTAENERVQETWCDIPCILAVSVLHEQDSLHMFHRAEDFPMARSQRTNITHGHVIITTRNGITGSLQH